METIIGAGPVTYTAKDLKDLADHFMMLAGKEVQLQDNALTKGAMMKHNGAANAYSDAAEILLNTTLTN